MVYHHSEFRHIGFRCVREQPAAGDRVLWDGEGWYFASPGEIINEHGSAVSRFSYWRRQVGPHGVAQNLRYFDELTRLMAWPRSHIDASGDYVEGVVVDYTFDWGRRRSPRALLEVEMLAEYLGPDWNRPHRVEREPIPEPVTEITEPEPEEWPAWADASV